MGAFFIWREENVTCISNFIFYLIGMAMIIKLDKKSKLQYNKYSDCCNVGDVF